MSTLDHNFNDIAAQKAEKSTYPSPFPIRFTFEERARLDAERGRSAPSGVMGRNQRLSDVFGRRSL